MWYKNIADRFFGLVVSRLRFLTKTRYINPLLLLVTKHACDRRTDGRTDRRTDGQTDRITTPKIALA